MPYYLAPYIGTGTVLDPFRPRGSDDPTWSAVDLRPDSSRLDGGGLNACLLWLFTPSSDPNLTFIADGEQEALSVPRRNALRTRLGLTRLVATRWDQIALEMLMVPPANAWKALRSSRVRNRYEVWLGPGAPLVVQPVIAGGASISENWNCANAASLTCQLTWTEWVGSAWEILSNRASCTNQNSNSALARADSDLDTDDHYVQATLAVQTIIGGSAWAPAVTARKDSTTTDTRYNFGSRTNALNFELNKLVSGTYTVLGTHTQDPAVGDVWRLECDGSTQRGLVTSVTLITTTDTAIVNNLRCGIGFYAENLGNVVAFDDWSAADLVAGDTLFAQAVY